jgi:hypothetical protein
VTEILKIGEKVEFLVTVESVSSRKRPNSVRGSKKIFKSQNNTIMAQFDHFSRNMGKIRLTGVDRDFEASVLGKISPNCSYFNRKASNFWSKFGPTLTIFYQNLVTFTNFMGIQGKSTTNNQNQDQSHS